MNSRELKIFRYISTMGRIKNVSMKIWEISLLHHKHDYRLHIPHAFLSTWMFCFQITRLIEHVISTRVFCTGWASFIKYLSTGKLFRYSEIERKSDFISSLEIIVSIYKFVHITFTNYLRNLRFEITLWIIFKQVQNFGSAKNNISSLLKLKTVQKLFLFFVFRI